MKIIALQAENIKKLVAVEIRPDGNLVQITGKNGQGKTSVLDSIWWALAGAKHIQSVPIREGEDRALIRLDLGELIVTRTFRTSKKGNVTSSIAVENAEGGGFSSPQSVLDNLLGELTFDPLAFSRMSSKEQFDALRGLVPDIDFEAIEEANKQDYDERTRVNRTAKEKRTLADEIEVAPGLPDERVDDSRLVDKMEEAGEQNAKIMRMEESLVRLKQDAVSARERYRELLKETEDAKRVADELEEKLENAPPLPEPIDVSQLREDIREAGLKNKQIEERDRKKALMEEARDLESESAKLTSQMENRDKEKQEAIAAAELPVEGISFGWGEVLLNDVPFEQASDAEQLRTSIAMAMALNPKLRVIRVRDGSLLDSDSMKVVESMADEKDFQIWIERVEDATKTGFVLEDGHLKASDGVQA